MWILIYPCLFLYCLIGVVYISTHLQLKLVLMKIYRCYNIFTPEEQGILKKYRAENFKDKPLDYEQIRANGKCPLTPEEVKLLYHSFFLYCLKFLEYHDQSQQGCKT